MLNARCNPVTLVALLVAAALGADALEAHPVLAIGAAAGLVYMGLRARSAILRASLRRNRVVSA